MRIAIIASTFPKLSETFILNQITGLCNRGHEVSIFSRFKPTESLAHPDVAKYKLLEKTQYFPSIPRSKWLCRLKASGWILRSLLSRPRMAIRILRYLLKRPEGFSYPILFTALSVFQRPVDVIHVHFGHNGRLMIPLKQIEPMAGFFTMFHGHDLLIGLDNGPDYYRELFEYADLILANSDFTRNRLLEQGADPARTRIHHMGIDVNAFPFQAGVSDFTAAPARILTIGRLCEQKGIEYSIRAIGCLCSAHPDIKVEYRIIGDGPLEPALKQLVQELKLSDTVRFLGGLEQTRVIEQLGQADLFLLTSIHEWLGMVLLEAQATGIPVIASRIGGIPEAVKPEESAFLVDPAKPEEIADRLYHLLIHPELRTRMGQEGRRHVEKNFDINTLNDTLEQIYRDICRNLKKQQPNGRQRKYV